MERGAVGQPASAVADRSTRTHAKAMRPKRRFTGFSSRVEMGLARPAGAQIARLCPAERPPTSLSSGSVLLAALALAALALSILLLKYSVRA